MSSAAMEIDDDDVGMEIGDDDVVWVKGDDDDVVSGRIGQKEKRR